MRRNRLQRAVTVGTGCAVALSGCAGSSDDRSGWAGTIDTLPGGTVVVENPAEGIWTEATRLRVEETLRLGSADEPGPELFGSIAAFEVDARGRLYVFDRQDQELRVFGPDGTHIRTVGGEGAGPGEFRQVIGMAWGGDGNLWIVDPPNNRVSVIDTSGRYVDSHWVLGSSSVYPWPGGVDTAGHFYTYASHPSGEPFRRILVRYTPEMEVLDTVFPPYLEASDQYFEHVSERGHSRVRVTIPYGSRLIWHLVRTGHIWFAVTGDYRLIQRSLAGDTLRIVSRDFELVPVTDAEVDSAVARLEWFTQQGGRVDRSRFPATKPAIRDFFVDDEARLWVVPVVRDMPPRGATRVLDVFGPGGRYLGRVDLPFDLAPAPARIVRDGMLYGVTLDEMMVSYLVAARLVEPASAR